VTTTTVLAEWHRIVETGDTDALLDLLAQDCTFHSPVVHSPQLGRAITAAYLTAALHVFDGNGFHYVDETVGERRIVLEFAVDLGGTHVNGVDLIDVADGRITAFKVMVRPLQAVNELHRRMDAMLAAVERS
jgi:ketosteroid isomerase-like protein